MIKRALISVSDKTGLIELGKALKHFHVEILTTGGTAQALQEAQIPHRLISDYTGFPEMMEGRLKTLHPKIYGGLLGRRDEPSHISEAQNFGIEWIDLVVVNLYPFQDVASRTKKPAMTDLIENIDIGGVTLLRAAAKNHEHVTVVTEPKDYGRIIQRLKDSPENPFDASFRYDMAVRAFRHTALYDSAISETLSQFQWTGSELQRQDFPLYKSIHGKRMQELRYGENPHQAAAFYRLQDSDEKWVMSESLQGKELSYNNVLDADGAWRTLAELPKNSCVIIKHHNPCGIGLGDNCLQSYQKAFQADSQSAFGGIVAISGTVDSDLAHKLSEPFFEIICAETFSVDAREILQKKKNLRLMLIPSDLGPDNVYRSKVDIRKVVGGFLTQDSDHVASFYEGIFGPEVHCVTRREPSEQEMAGLRLAWVAAKNVKSNGVVITNATQTLGIGCGQVNRRYSTESACSRAVTFDSNLKVCGSDGFFPFADSIEILRQSQVTAIVQPGGSIRDAEVIEACDKAGIAMLFTKIRHFSH